MSDKKSKAILSYIDNNWEPLSNPECNKCQTKEGLGYDSLSDLIFCKPCLIKDLELDPEALIDYYYDGD
jgi:hypothetical protein